MSPARNVKGGELQVCSLAPLTGFMRDGLCQTGPQDLGSHTVCALMTGAFLEYSRQCGNDLVTPAPEYGFAGLKPGDRWCLCAARWLEAAEAGLKPGDRWCLCAARWLEAAEAGVAPPVILDATHERALRVVALADLEYHARVATP